MAARYWRFWVSAIGIVGACVSLVLIGVPAASAASSSDPTGVLAPRPAPIRGLAGALADRPEPGTPATRAPRSAASVPIGTWRALGPAPIGPPYLLSGGFDGGANSGRITAVAVAPASGLHPGRIYVGAAGGGIWTSDDGGTTWVARTDTAANLSVGALAIDPSNPNHLIVGTGEANQCGDCYPGSGVLVSSDGGNSWTIQNPSGVFTGRHIAQVAIDPSNSSHEFAATDGGLYVTANGGTSWAKPTSSTYTALDGSVTSVVINPTTPTIVYIGGKLGSGGAHTVAKSTNGGGTWAAADTGITAPGSGQLSLIALAIAKSSPATLYASVGSGRPVALYKTITGAAGWTKRSATPDYTGLAYSYGPGLSGEQGWYDNVLAVDPANANNVIAGGIALVATTTGGTRWTNVNGGGFGGGVTNELHPDQHALAFASDGTVWIGDDGGVYHYTPSSSVVANANGNLNITQFYFGFNVVGNTLLAGSQDNASARTASGSLGPWTGIFAGDGGPSAITSNHPQTQFIEADRSLLVTTDAFATTLQNITPTPSSSFSPPMIVVPSTTTPANPTVYYGGLDLFRTTNPTTGASWTQRTFLGQGVTAVAASTSGQYVYVGFADGTIEVSTDGGLTFTPLARTPSLEAFVTGLSVNPVNAKAITASFSYNDTRYRPAFPHAYQYSWRTAPGSGAWTNITGNLPNRAVSRVIYDSGALVAATDGGVYATGAPAGGSTSWTRVGSGLPHVQVQDLFLNRAGLFALTHGRGAWKLPPPPADLAVAVTVSQVFDVFTNGEYTVTVTNNGPASASAVSLTDAVPTGTTFVGESQTSGPTFRCNNPAFGATGSTTCTIATLAANTSATFKLTYKLADSSLTSVDDTAKVSSSVNPDPTPANNTSTATACVC